jgi:cohesin complex subunit SCC1
MFYSDVLLAKSGPLARVWLASNLDRRLTKRDCLQQNLEDSIDIIVDETAAPMALRLSGQLLLGVVKIYKRKTGYLLEDCNEALLKIKLVRYVQGYDKCCLDASKGMRALGEDQQHYIIHH